MTDSESEQVRAGYSTARFAADADVSFKQRWLALGCPTRGASDCLAPMRALRGNQGSSWGGLPGGLGTEMATPPECRATCLLRGAVSRVRWWLAKRRCAGLTSQTAGSDGCRLPVGRFVQGHSVEQFDPSGSECRLALRGSGLGNQHRGRRGPQRRPLRGDAGSGRVVARCRRSGR